MGFDSTGESKRREVIRDLENAINKLEDALVELDKQKGIGAELIRSDLVKQIKNCRSAISTVRSL